MRAKSSYLPLLLFAMLFALPAMGQEWAGRGRLQGDVRGPDGKPIAGAKVFLRMGTVENLDPANPGPGPEPVLSDAKGHWSVLGLAQGSWTILIVKDGLMSSQGMAQSNEFGPAPLIRVTMKEIPKEVIAAAQAEADKASVTGQAKAALEHGNQLLAEARAAGGKDTAKLTAARQAYEEGIAKLDQADAKEPAAIEAIKQTKLSVLQAIAGIDYELGDTDKAIAALKSVVEQKPDDAGSIQLLINLLVQSGKEAEAKQYMARLPQGAKVDPNTYLNLGIQAFNDGNMEKAFENFDRAVKENPEVPDGYYYRGMVWINRGKNAQAKADLEKFLQLAPEHPKADDAREFLKAL